MKTIPFETQIACAETAAAKPSGRWALTGLALSLLLSSLGTSIANVSLPTLAQAFTASFQEVQWVVLAYLVAATSLIVTAGRLGDLLGRRRLLSAGIAWFTAASVLCGLAQALWLLALARAAQGCGAAAMMALTLALVGEVVPPAKLGRAMGLLGTMSAVGTAFGPALGGMLIAAFGWPAIFLLNVPLGLTALVLVHQHLPADRRHASSGRAGFDGPGTVLLATALAAYAFALTIGRGQFGAFNLALLAVAAGMMGLFGFVESRAAAPLVRLALFRDATLRAGLLTSGLVSTVMMTTLVVGPFYLTLALGLNAATVGLVLSAGPLVAALTGVPAGRLTDQLGAERVTMVGLSAIACGTLALALLPAPLGIVGYLAPIGAITIGYAFFQTANNTAVMRVLGADQRGVGAGLLHLARNLGLITGAAGMAAVFAHAAQATDLSRAAPAAVATGMKVAFAVATMLTAVALGFTSRGAGQRVRRSDRGTLSA